jgi:23S rRNA pseudouridine1911/1915/1917 synthase
MGLIQNATRNKIQTATEGNFVNDATVKSNYKVKAFDGSRDADASSFENHIPENIPLILFMKMTPCC